MKDKYKSAHSFGALLFVAATTAAVAQEETRSDSHHAVDEIIVTATPLSRTVEQLAQPTAVLSGDDLARKQSSSIGEVVSQEAGVSSTFFGPIASRPVIRGQYGERVRVLLNGLDSLDASALSEDHQAGLDSILSQRIEIVRGPATLLYGSGAAGGLVNVVDNRIAEQPLDQPLGGTVAANGDTAIDSTAVAGRLAFGKGAWNWQVDGFTRSTGDLEIPGLAESAVLRAAEEEEGEEHEQEAGTVGNTDSRTTGTGLGGSYATDRGFLGLSVTTYDSNYGVAGHAHEHHEEEHGAAEEEQGDEDVRIDLEQLRFDLRGDLEIDGPFRVLKFRAARNNYEHTEFEGAEIGTVYETDGTDIRFEAHHAPSGGFEGALGLQFKRIDFTAVGDEAFVPPSDTQRSSLFGFEEWRLHDRLALQGSFRIERQTIDTPASGMDYSGTAYGASLGAVWNPGDLLDVAVNLSVTERHPNSTELYANGPHVAVQRYEIGSVAAGRGILDNEVTTNLDVTLRGGEAPLEWTVTGFYNAADDYILLRPTASVIDDFQVFEYRQRDVDLYGIEAEARFELLDTADGHLHGRVYTDFVHAEERDSGEYVARMPPLRIGGGLHYTQGVAEFSLSATWHDDQRKVAPNELPTDGYTLLRAELSYFFAEQDLFVYLRGSNLTDEDARQHTSPLKDTVPLPGRALQAGLRWNF